MFNSTEEFVVALENVTVVSSNVNSHHNKVLLLLAINHSFFLLFCTGASVSWPYLFSSVVFCGLAMLFKEQGITVLVR